MPVVSSNGRVASAANIEQREVVFRDGEIVGAFREVGWPVALSRDGRSLAFSYRTSTGKKRVWADGVEGPEFKHVSPPLLGASLVYRVEEGEEFFMVVDHRVFGPFEELGQPIFSADGSTLAFWDGHVMRIGDRRQRVQGSPTDPALSADGRVAAYGVGPFLIHADREIPLPKRASRAFISDDGLHAGAFLREKPEEVWGWYRGELAGPWPAIWEAVISPDRNRVAYVVGRDSERWLAVGDFRDGPYSFLSKPVWSPDGRRIAFGAATEQRVIWRVLSLPAY